MNAGRLHAVLEMILRDYRKHEILPLLEKVTTTLSDSIESAAEEAAITFVESLGHLYRALEESPFVSVRPSQAAILEQIGAVPNVGHGLRGRIQDAIQNNNVTPANALTELNAISEEVSGFRAAVESTVNGLEKLKIPYDELDPGESEIGALVPLSVFDGNLDGLQKELHEFDKALRIFGELVDENPESPKIRTVGSSVFQMFLDSTPAIALCVATALERLCALYKQILEIKALRKQLSEKAVPKTVTAPLESHEEEIATAQIDKIADDLIKEFSRTRDKGRENELRNGVRAALRFFAAQIDAGVDMEVHSEPPTPKNVAESAGENVNSGKAKKALEEARQIAARIDKAGKAMLSLRRATGPILALQQTSAENKQEHRKAKKRTRVPRRNKNSSP